VRCTRACHHEGRLRDMHGAHEAPNDSTSKSKAKKTRSEELRHHYRPLGLVDSPELVFVNFVSAREARFRGYLR